MSKTAEFQITEAGDIKMVVTERDRWGTVRKRSQHTFRRRQFESALRTAKVIVPWDKVTT